MTNKDKYRLFCEKEKGINIFSQAWWLDSVAGETWDVCMVEKGNEVIATMPYVITKKYGFISIGHPPLTQNLGPWLKQTGAKYSKVLSKQKGLMQALIEQLPDYTSFYQQWHYSQQNWLPFYWNGFEETTRYTYVIEDLSDLEHVWNDFQDNIKSDVRKAEKRFSLKVRTDLSIEDFIDLNEMTFSRQKIDMPDSRNLIKKVIQKAHSRNQCKWFIAQDEDGRNHAGVLIIWDSQSAYYLMGGGNPSLRNSGATSLCMWEAIRFASSVTRSFDFEGSMIEPIERFFRGFGAVQKTYFCVSSKPSNIVNRLRYFKKTITG